MILGVDVSTSITGLAIVADGSIVYYDSVDLRKYKNVLKRVVFSRKRLWTSTKRTSSVMKSSF